MKLANRAYVITLILLTLCLAAAKEGPRKILAIRHRPLERAAL